MAFTAVLVTQDRGGALFGRHQRRGLRFDHGQRIALGAVLAFAALGAVVTVAAAFEALAARAVVTVTLPVFARAFVPGTIITRTFIPRTIIALAARTVVALAILTFLALALTLTVVPVAPTVAAAAFETIAPRTVVALAVVTLTVIALTILTVVTPAFAARLLALAVGRFAVRRRVFGGFGGRRLGAALILEVDVEAAGDVVAAQDLGRRLGRLHGAHDAEVVLGVLQVAFSQNTVAGRRGVARELLVLLKNVLGVAAHLHAVRAVGVERPVRVLLLRLAAAAAAIAAALALHTLEISHSLCPPTVRASPECARPILSP